MANQRQGFSKFRGKLWALCRIERQIRRGRNCTARTLAADLEVDPRTIRRYIALMKKELGAPIEWNPIEERYEFTESTWRMPNVHLSDQELVALVVAARSMAAIAPAPIGGSLDGLLAKLLDQLPEDLRDEMARVGERVDFVPSPTPSKGQEWVGPLMDAVRERFTVEMEYFAAGRNAQTARKVDPYHLRFYAGTWYLIGFDHLTKYIPVFNLARIRGLRVTEDEFRAKPFSVAEYFKHAFGITAGGTPRLIRIRLTGRAARTVGERVWPEGFAFVSHGETGILSGQVGKLDDVLQWVASLDGEATLLAENEPDC
jgi:predicted DNA-binding transcriptional regulator YafY